MRNIFLLSKRYPRKDKDKKVVETVSFEYLALPHDTEFEKSFEMTLERQMDLDIWTGTVDKISFRYPREYLSETYICDENGCTHRNPERYKRSYLGGAVTIRLYAQWFWVHIHREFIPLDMKLNDYIESIFRYLVFCTTLFKIPLRKTQAYINKPPYKTEKYPTNTQISTQEEYFDHIYSLRSLACIELCFEFSFKISDYLPKGYFFIYKKTTYYSQDYRIRKNGTIVPSMMALYDKVKEQKERKNKHLSNKCWERFEIRLYPISFSCMKGERGLVLLDNDYRSLVVILTKHIKSHIRRLQIDFSEFIKHLPEEYDMLRNLLE